MRVVCHTTLIEDWQRLVSEEVPPCEQALGLIARIPSTGNERPALGHDADMSLLNNALHPCQAVVAGRCVYCAD